MSGPEFEPLLMREEVAALLRVKPLTVSNWARRGRLHPVRTLGGHRRYRKSEIDALMRGEKWELPSECAAEAA